MDEKSLHILLQKHIVSVKDDALTNPWRVDDLLVACVAYIFPCLKDISSQRANEKYSLTPLIVVLNKIKNDVIKRMSSYSEEALKSALCYEWIPNLNTDEKKSLLLNTSAMFCSIDDKGFVLFRENTFKGLKNTDFTDYHGRQYGQEPYTPQETGDNILRQERQYNRNRVDDAKLGEVSKALRERYVQLRTVRKNSGIDGFEVVEDITTPKYAWQWNLTSEEYIQLKNLLKDNSKYLSFVLNNKYKFCCKLIQLYASEWYKREFNGNDQCGNAFSQIGVETGDFPRNLCEGLGLNEDTVYRAQIDENGHPTGNCRWLDTIYVDGGLPLQYLINRKGSFFAKNVRNIIEKEEDAIDDIGLDVGDGLEDLCDNQVVNQSYKGRIVFPDEDEASIYDFIQATIVDESFTVADFEGFSIIISEARKDLEKFKVRLGAVKMGNRIVIKPQLYLKKDDGVPYAISQRRLNEWSLNQGTNSFEVSIKSNACNIWKARFRKCLRGDFIMYPQKGVFNMSMPSNLVYEEWSVWVDGQKISSTAISNPLAKDGFIQLYSVDGFVWSSQPTNNYEKTAVLFDSNRVSLREECYGVNTIDIPNTALKWFSFDEHIVLVINGSEKSLYDKSGTLYVELENEHSIMTNGGALNVLSGNRLPYQKKDGLKEKVYIIPTGSRPSFRVYLTRMGNDARIEERKDITNEVSWSYRIGGGGFVELKDDSINQSGYLELQIHYPRKNKNRIVSCFALNPNARIDENSQRNITSFRDYDSLNIGCDTIEVNSNMIYWEFHIDMANPVARYSISDNMGSLKLVKYCPIDGFLLEDKRTREILETNIGNEDTLVPTAILRNVSVRRIPDGDLCDVNNGYHKNELGQFMQHKYQDSIYLGKCNRLIGKTFTHSFEYKGDRYELGTQNERFKHLSFVFLNLDTYEISQIELNRDGKSYFFDVQNKNEGIIIQNVNVRPLPLVVIKPMYVPGNTNNRDLTSYEKKQERFRRIDDYHNQLLNTQDSSRLDSAMKSFKVAAKTGMYFGAFDSLLGLFAESDIDNKTGDVKCLVFSKTVYFADFFTCYCDDCNRSGSRIDFDSLWRMADEFLFDWILIPRDKWANEYRQKVTELLKHKPGRGYAYLDFVENRFWNFDPYPIKRSNDQSVNVFLRTISQQFVQRYRTEDDFWIGDRMGTTEFGDDTFYYTIKEYINQ